jgi:hypothetical protein
MGPTDVQYETGNTLQAKPSPTNTRQSSGADMTALKVPGGFETAAREAAADEAAEAEAAEEEAPVEGA